METSKAMNLSWLIFRWLILVGGLPWMLSASRKVSFPWLVTVGQSLVILGSKYDLEVEWIWVLKLSALVSIEMSVCGRGGAVSTTRGLRDLILRIPPCNKWCNTQQKWIFFFAFLKENFIEVCSYHTHIQIIVFLSCYSNWKLKVGGGHSTGIDSIYSWQTGHLTL